MAKLSWGSILFLWVLSKSAYATDTTKPVITLQGSNPAIVILNTTYSDAGATATDDIDGSNVIVIPNIQSVDTSEVGSYSVEYTATDSAGNTQTATRTVNVIVNIIPIITLLLLDDNEPDDGVDRTPPVITLFGDNPVFVLVGSSYMDAGASATDNIDGPLNVSDNANIVSTSTVASYSIKFMATDNAGNTGTAFRTVNIVEDNTAPEITLNGNASVTIEAGSTYTDAGALALDDFDGSVAVTPTINFDTASVGTHSNAVTYTATDSSNNIATAYRDVEVVDTTPPAITTNSITIEAGSLYTNDGVTTTDNSNGVITLKRNSLVDTATVGQTTVSYTATDSSGHSVNKDITVVIADTTPPEIIIAGEASVTIEAGETYADAGVVTDDNSNGVVNIETTGSIIDTSVVGTYTVTYTATDPSGRSAEATRTVNVVDTTAPEISLTGRNPITFIKNSTYSEGGFITNNNSTGLIVVTDDVATAVDMATPGIYSVTYTATDAATNQTATTTRTVNVIVDDSLDDTPPIVTLLGSESVEVVQNSVYVDAGVTAIDDLDGNISLANITTPAVDTSLLSTTSINIIATDAAGNEGSVTRQIVVVEADTTPPSITIIGGDSITVPVNTGVGATYNDAGAIADDDGSYVDVFTTANTVNISVIGTYTNAVTYAATDSSGNTQTSHRTVIVEAASDLGDLTGQWHLDENTGGTTNSLAGNNNLTLNNMTSSNWVTGKSRYALDFIVDDQQDASIINLADDVLQTTSITLSAWVKPKSSNGLDWGEWIAAQGDNYGLYIETSTKKLVFYVRRDLLNPFTGDDVGENWTGVNSTNSIIFDSNEWQHVAGTFDATTNTMKVFVDGIEAGSKTVGEGINYDIVDGFTIGSMKGSRFFHGAIDEVTVYNKAHNGADISGLMQRVAEDTQKPMITLIGADTINLVIGTDYIEQNAVAVDDIDGTLANVIIDAHTVDTSTIGTYYVTYLATDAAGNTRKAIRTVNVIAEDVSPPVITVSGRNPAIIPLIPTPLPDPVPEGMNYNDKGAIATDNVDSEVTVIVNSSSVDNTTAGVYAVTFTASDAAGNIETATRKVLVVENLPVDESVFDDSYDGYDKPVEGRRGSVEFNDYIDSADPGATADWVTQSTGNIIPVTNDATLADAIQVAQPGERIQLASGIYKMRAIQLSGSPGSPITIESAPGQWAVFDGEKPGSATSIKVQGSWLNFRNFEVKRGLLGSIYTGAKRATEPPHLIEEIYHHNLYEGLKIHNNSRGFDLTDGSHHCMIRYNESYHNFSNNGQDGDGFGVWTEDNEPIGDGVILEHNIAWGNADDGIDMWGTTTTVTMRNNISRNNGYNVLGIDSANFVGNGNGFKLAQPEVGGTGHIVIGNIADNNPVYGFDYNSGTALHYLKGNIGTDNTGKDYVIPNLHVDSTENTQSGGLPANYDVPAG